MWSFEFQLSTHSSRKPALSEHMTNIFTGLRPPTRPYLSKDDRGRFKMLYLRRSWEIKPFTSRGESSSMGQFSGKPSFQEENHLPAVIFQVEGDFFFGWIPNAWFPVKIFPARPTHGIFTSMETLVTQPVRGPSRAVLSGEIGPLSRKRYRSMALLGTLPHEQSPEHLFAWWLVAVKQQPQNPSEIAASIYCDLLLSFWALNHDKTRGYKTAAKMFALALKGDDVNCKLLMPNPLVIDGIWTWSKMGMLTNNGLELTT